MSDVCERIKRILAGAEERELDETECRAFRDAAARIAELEGALAKHECPTCGMTHIVDLPR